MWKKSKRNKVETDFTTDIPEYSDQEILNILKKGKYYQAEAVELALEEAVKRELINNQEDLYDEEFRVQPLKFKLFPKIEDNEIKIKIRKSIARAVLIVGLFPMIWGILKLNNGIFLEGTLVATLGIIWIFVSAKLIQQANTKALNIITILTVLSFIYVGKSLIVAGNIIFMDVFIIMALYGLLIYGLQFIRRMKPI